MIYRRFLFQSERRVCFRRFVDGFRWVWAWAPATHFRHCGSPLIQEVT
jgi:hypothetical protein